MVLKKRIVLNHSNYQREIGYLWQSCAISGASFHKSKSHLLDDAIRRFAVAALDDAIVLGWNLEPRQRLPLQQRCHCLRLVAKIAAFAAILVEKKELAMDSISLLMFFQCLLELLVVQSVADSWPRKWKKSYQVYRVWYSLYFIRQSKLSYDTFLSLWMW